MEPGTIGASQERQQSHSRSEGVAGTNLRSQSRAQRRKRLHLHLEKLTKDLYLTGALTSAWALLPTNLLIRALKLLPLRDRAHCSCVCKRWNAVYHMPDLWHKFEFEFMQSTTLMSSSTPRALVQYVFEKHRGDLRQVIINVDGHRQSADAAYDVLVQLGSCNLQSLQVASPAHPCFSSVQPQKVVSALTKIFANSALSVLAIEETPMNDALLNLLATKSNATLVMLKITSCSSLSTEGISRALMMCLRLCDLSIDYKHLSDRLIDVLTTSSHVPLRKLNVRVVESVDESNLQSAPWQGVGSSSWKLLEQHSPDISFTLQFCSIREERFPHFFQCPLLVTTLHFLCFVPDSVLHRIAMYCPRLQVLLITNFGCEPINEAIIDVGRKCRHLQSLELSGCVVRCTTLVQLAKMCGPRLTSLVANEEMMIEDEECNIETMSREVSNFLQRPWSVEFLPSWVA